MDDFSFLPGSDQDPFPASDGETHSVACVADLPLTDSQIIGQTRRNQILPLGWSHLSKVDLFEIRQALKHVGHPDGAARSQTTRPTLIDLEAELAIAIILTTGRKLDDVRRMRITVNKESAGELGPGTEYLLRSGDEPKWHFIAGTASQIETQLSQNDAGRPVGDNSARSGRPGVCPPVEKIVMEIIDRFPDRRFSSENLTSSGPLTLFSRSRGALVARINVILARRRGPAWKGRPRRSTRTYHSLERFLTRAITHESGGDLVGAIRLTRRDEMAGRNANFYGETFVSNVVRTAKRANAIFRGETEKFGNVGYNTQKIAADKAPLWAEVRYLAAECEYVLKWAYSHNRQAAHIAITYQTIALVSFATGHRGMAEDLPSSAAIDPQTGFCRIHDKMIDRPDRARMIWVAEAARKQIAIYERHVEGLGDLLDKQELDELCAQMQAGRLPFFSIRNREPVRLTFRMFWEYMSHHLQLTRPMSHNAGRHWLRTVLAGRCPNDVVQAFFGHWLMGNEPWSFGSCLDPIHFRSELMGSIPALLEAVGWSALNVDGTTA